jgi:eukaryotic translation initiation factor 2C
MGVTLQPAEAITFALQSIDGGAPRHIGIIQYYEEYYGVKIMKPRVPCVQMKCTVSSSADWQYGKKAFIPLAFVKIVEWNSLPPSKLTVEQSGA